MRKITKSIINAFLQGDKLSIDNTTTDGKALFLFGNKIAEKRADGMYITNAGWNTNTTKERLNALPSVHIHQAKGKWFLNGNIWDGKWTKINQQ
jgi:hypothetical protein